MPILLTTSAPIANRRLMLRVGQEARVGRSEWLELSIPGDPLLADEHFVVRCGSDAVVETIDDEVSFSVEGTQLKRLTLSDSAGEETSFIAGATEFMVTWTPDLASVPNNQVSPIVTAQTESPEIDPIRLIDSVAKSMSLSDGAITLAESADQWDAYVDDLQNANLDDDAVRYLAGLLPDPLAVTWAVEMSDLATEQTHDSAGTNLTETIKQWMDTPLESRRAAVQKQLANTPCDNVTKWIAQAIVYSGGSLAPDGQPIIPPPAHLSAVSIVTAHRWAISTELDRKIAIDRWIVAGKRIVQSNLSECVTKSRIVNPNIPSQGDL